MRRGSFILLASVFILPGCSRSLRTDGIYVIPYPEVFNFRVVYEEIQPDSVDIELLEWVVFAFTNIERERYGLPPFRLSKKLRRAAQQHSSEMTRLGYFSHTSPRKEYRTLRTRLYRQGVRVGKAAENIALQTMRAQLPVVYSYPVGNEHRWRNFWRNYGRPYTYLEFGQVLVRRWMNSPGHRRNILNPQFVYLGIGAAVGEYYGTKVAFFTQNFSSTNW
jgi:uncharacterized protein YkwD